MLSNTSYTPEFKYLKYLKTWELPKWLIIDEWWINYGNIYTMNSIHTYQKAFIPSIYQNHLPNITSAVPSSMVNSLIQPFKLYLIYLITSSSLKYFLPHCSGFPDIIVLWLLFFSVYFSLTSPLQTSKYISWSLPYLITLSSSVFFVGSSNQNSSYKWCHICFNVSLEL